MVEAVAWLSTDLPLDLGPVAVAKTSCQDKQQVVRLLREELGLLRGLLALVSDGISLQGGYLLPNNLGSTTVEAHMFLCLLYLLQDLRSMVES